ncbi:hypothetical protein ABPG74_019942 [Tetrahymena malaccensis]
MSKALKKYIVKTISENISKECVFQDIFLRELIQLMFNQKKQFQKFEYLGSSAYSLVLKAYNTEQNRYVALKFLSCTNNEDINGIESLKKEYEMLQKNSQSEYLVSVYDYFYLFEEDVEEDEDGVWGIALIKERIDDYLAPEVKKGQSRIQSDLFSLGLVLLELDNLNELSENWIDDDIKREIYEGKVIASKYQINTKSNIYKIAQICLKQNYLERTTAGDLLSNLIKLHGKPLKFKLTSMILDGQIPQQEMHIYNKNDELKIKMQTYFEIYTQNLLDNTELKVKENDFVKQNAIVKVLPKLLQSLHEEKKYTNNFQILSFGIYGIILATQKVNFNNKEIVLKIQKIFDDQAILNEITIMKQLREPLVVQLYDHYIIEKITAPEKYVVLELEKCSCSLKDYIDRQREEGEFSDEDKLIIAKQKNTEIYKYIKLLVVWDRFSRATLSDIVESDPKNFASSTLQMKQIKSISNVVESKSKIEIKKTKKLENE